MQLRGLKAVAVLAILAWMAPALHASEPDLSAAETTMVDRRIASLKSSGDRHMAEGWSNTKKVAELLCRPAALPVLKKTIHPSGPGLSRD
jgi:hypothetical protein